MICLYEAELKENGCFGESQVFCLWRTMTTLQAMPPTEQLVMELGLSEATVGLIYRVSAQKQDSQQGGAKITKEGCKTDQKLAIRGVKLIKILKWYHIFVTI